MPYTTPSSGTAITVAYATANIRDQVVTPFASDAARASAITAPIEGMVTYLTDADALEVYNGSDWIPAGPLVVDALNVTASAPFISALGAGSLTTEVSSKLRLTAPRVYNNQLYRISGSFIFAISATGTDYTWMCREDSASGTIVGTSFLSQGQGAATGQHHNFSFEWPCAADASSKVFFFTAVRATGAGTLAIYNTWQSGRSLNFKIERTGASALFRSVA